MCTSKSISNIRIFEQGSECFAFNTIRWPPNVVGHPIVYTACALQEGSIYLDLAGFHWITKEQFDWLVVHRMCDVESSGGSPAFYCRNHVCWEVRGEDYPSGISTEIICTDLDSFEREV
jgi:hypothetical protein